MAIANEGHTRYLSHVDGCIRKQWPFHGLCCNCEISRGHSTYCDYRYDMDCNCGGADDAFESVDKVLARNAGNSLHEWTLADLTYIRDRAPEIRLPSE